MFGLALDGVGPPITSDVKSDRREGHHADHRYPEFVRERDAWPRRPSCRSGETSPERLRAFASRCDLSVGTLAASIVRRFAIGATERDWRDVPAAMDGERHAAPVRLQSHHRCRMMRKPDTAVYLATLASEAGRAARSGPFVRTCGIERSLAESSLGGSGREARFLILSSVVGRLRHRSMPLRSSCRHERLAFGAAVGGRVVLSGGLAIGSGTGSGLSSPVEEVR